MKIIFLDFDGVITTRKSHYRLDPDKMAIIKRICDETGAKIVISSSWRTSDLEGTKKRITDVSRYFVPVPFFDPDLVVGITPFIYTNVTVEKMDGTREETMTHCSRGEEIRSFISSNYDDIDGYVIIDDEVNDMLVGQKDHAVRTDGLEGITEEDADRCIEILNRQNKDEED